MTVIFESKNKQTRIVKLEKEKYKIVYPYYGEAKKFWTNFPWHHLQQLKKIGVGEGLRERIFKATSVQTLPQFLSKEKKLHYQQALALFGMVGIFIQALEKFGHTILSLEMNDIIVVNDRIFLLMEDSNLTKIGNHRVEIKNPLSLKKYQKNKFVAPEIEKITSFPKKILPFSAYYNLAALTIFCLFKKYLINDKESEMVLNPIFQTKLYWALKRCLEESPENRFFLII